MTGWVLEILGRGEGCENSFGMQKGSVKTGYLFWYERGFENITLTLWTVYTRDKLFDCT